jgi:hypothetical protein
VGESTACSILPSTRRALASITRLLRYRLENEIICLVVLPELGAKIWNLIHKPSGRNLLWHHPFLPPARNSFGSKFDDVWSGGWDELIPNDVPTPVSYGDTLPDHGEAWSQESEWTVLDAGSDCAAVRFINYGRVWPTRFEKTISLNSEESFFRIKYRYTNMASKPFDFLWNIHPALGISPATRLDLPARRGLVEPWGTDLFEGWTEYEWPNAVDRNGQTVDMRIVPPKGNWADHHYLPDVKAGWYAVTDTQERIGFGIAFPTNIFPHLWLFRAFGGWRGLYTLIVEILTGYPHRLEVAREQGHCGHLVAGQTLEAEITAVVYTGLTSVEGIEPDGKVVTT